MFYELNNGTKLIYEHKEGDITSFCIGFNAGALEEEGFSLGTAHALEHMLYKGTQNRTEFEINELSDEIFGFTNAMTNYPYVIYYGTTLSENFSRGLELMADILLNPSFPEEGFNEEISIIKEELKEWSEDIYQLCEDELLYNAFKRRRIKNLIIGTQESIETITLEELRRYYERYYVPNNCVISVVSSLELEDAIEIVEGYFGAWEKGFSLELKETSDSFSTGVFEKVVKGAESAKIQYVYPMDSLTQREIKILNLFNLAFGEGTSSILYDEIRTKNGLAYEVYSTLKNERGIKLFSIVLGTSKENIHRVMEIVNGCIYQVKNNRGYFSKDKIDKLYKSFRLKRALKLERTIELCKYLTTYELMYGSFLLVSEETEEIDGLKEEEILDALDKLFNRGAVQIIKPV